MEKLFLEVPTLEREQEAFEYIDEFIENDSDIVGSNGLSRYRKNYQEWLNRLEMESIPEFCRDGVPSRTFFLIRENDDKIVGMITIYLGFNKRINDFSGNICYGIRPFERGKGYNNINLFLGLKVAQEYGMNNVLLTANKKNIASVSTMKSFGGVKVKDYFDEDEGYQIVHYVINVNKSLEENQERFENSISLDDIKRAI